MRCEFNCIIAMCVFLNLDLGYASFPFEGKGAKGVAIDKAGPSK